MRVAIALATLGLMTWAVAAQEGGDKVRGQVLAETLCAECHGTSAGRTNSPMPGPATFETIANTPGMTALALSVWLTTPHREMPHLILSAQEREDIIAYITSLRR